MLTYLILTGGNLGVCLIAIGRLEAAFPNDLYPIIGVLGGYLALGPILFVAPFREPAWFQPSDGHRGRPAFSWFPIYLTALILLFITTAFSLEFHRQLVELRIPLVVAHPTWMTLLFFGGYLPVAVLLCSIMARLTRQPMAVKTPLLNPGYGIPISLPPVQTTGESIVVAPMNSAPETSRKNQLTSDRTEFINNPMQAEMPEGLVPMETVELSMLKQIQDQFSSMTNLSLLAYDARGDLLCEPSGENPLCRTVQKTAKGEQHCKSHCGRSIGLALQEKETVFFQCAMNLHVFSIPIILDDKTKLVVLGGKSFLNPQEFADGQEKAESLDLSKDDLTPLTDRIRVHENPFLVQSARFLESALPFLFSTAHEKNTLNTKLSRLITLFTLTADLKNDLPQLIHTVLNTLGILFNLNTASVLLWDRRQQLFKTAATFGQKTDLIRDYQTDGAEGLVRTLLDQRRPVSSVETLEILRAGFPPGLAPVYLFPLFIQDHRMTGLLGLFDTPLEDEEIRVISAFVQQASLIRENAQLLQEREDLAKDVSVLLDIAKTVGSALESEDLFLIILEKATQFLQAEQGSLMLLDEDRSELTVKAMKGLNKKIVELMRIRPGEGISGKVLSTGTALVVSDIESDDRIAQEKRPRYKTKSFISIPLKLDGRTIGVLNIADKMTGEVFSEEDLQLLISIGAYASVAIERSKFYQKTEELKRISITDPLTGLLNRRYFQERMSEEIERSRRHHLPLSLIMIDLDDFKSVNDTLGHLVGDEALKILARCLRNSIRTIDVAARYGGEEFTVILPQTSKTDAYTIAERICTEVHRLDLPFVKTDQKLVLSVSVGLATYPDDAESLEDLIRNADIALYAAKSKGKNRVVIYEK
ncbi:MAG: diguanylate cyclase [Nitrospirae bacterium]|nr:diguanylate cyclase [Nitrospirota bacterium]